MFHYHHLMIRRGWGRLPCLHSTDTIHPIPHFEAEMLTYTLH